jgi:Ca2+/Na+ antiporter
VALIVATMAVLIYALRLHHYSRLQIFGTIAMFFFFEIFLYVFYVIFKKEKAREKDIESVEQLKAYFNQDNLIFDTPGSEAGFMPEDPVKDKLEIALEFLNPWLFKFVDNYIDLLKISKNNTSILSTDDLVRHRNSDDKTLSLIINLYRLNHFRRVNQYFLEVHRKLEAGGYFIGKVSTMQTYKEKIKKMFPKYFSEVLYVLHFVFFRIFPKLLFTKQIYFAITRGRNRIISRAEVLGRLYFCGFEIIAEQKIDYDLYFIARKVTSPSSVTNPSYGPLVKMSRSGMNGQSITVYKFRTMHPYSEFLQKYIYEKNNLRVGGKLNNDFRVTGWGKIMRKYWLDELPMLYNWIRGELKIVGVRPLSSHYLSLYDNELQELRKNIKPGLIPPFYVDLPKTFNEICESEKRYLLAYKRNPIKTQCSYFIKAMNNIIIKNARSQ